MLEENIIVGVAEESWFRAIPSVKLENELVSVDGTGVDRVDDSQAGSLDLQVVVILVGRFFLRRNPHRVCSWINDTVADLYLGAGVLDAFGPMEFHVVGGEGREVN